MWSLVSRLEEDRRRNDAGGEVSEDRISAWKEVIAKVASFVAADFPDVEKEDLIQQLYLFILEKTTLTDPDSRGATTILTKAAKDWAWNQRKQHLHLTAQYSYRKSDVRAILETAFDHDRWSGVRVPDDARSEFNDVFLEINTDVKNAWVTLAKSDKKIIFEKFALGIDPDASGRVKLSRAIQKLTDKLNFYQGLQKPEQFIGRRRVVNNATAQARIHGLTDD